MDVVFVIDGKDYEAPSLETLDMGERRVMYDLCGIVQEDFVQQEGEPNEEHEARVAGMTRHPGFLESLMHIAYARGNPGVKRERVQAVIDKTNYLDAIEKWLTAEGDESPPSVESTSSPDGRSPSETAGSSTSSGAASATDSDPAASDLPPTGTTRSDTSPTLGLIKSAG